MRPVCDLDVLARLRCGGRLRIVATVHDPTIARAILDHLGMASDPDPRVRSNTLGLPAALPPLLPPAHPLYASYALENGPAEARSRRPAARSSTMRSVSLARRARIRTHVDGLRAHGLTKGEIFEVTLVPAYFNYTNRVAEGRGVEPEPR